MLLFLRSILRESGWRRGRAIAALRAWPRYLAERREFRRRLGPDGGGFAWGRDFPILGEREAASGSIGAYALQDLLVAKWIREDGPMRHVDVGSRIDGFICHLAVFREVEVIDIRPAPGVIPGVVFHQLDVMGACPAEWKGALGSLSCLHTVEHFGLGRYGDALDPQGHEKGVARLKEMVAPGGRMYLSTPIGPQRIEFNAHRIFAVSTVLGWFAEGWEIERLAVIDDEESIHLEPERTAAAVGRNFGCRAGVVMLAARKLGG
jgi:hypothetical protein